MTENNLRRMLDESAARIDVSTGPDLATPARRRTLRWVPVAAVAGMLAVVAAVVGVERLAGSDGDVASESPDRSTAVSIDLPTNNWEPGDGGDGALLQGVLSYDGTCVRVGRIPVQWPAGFTATSAGPGDVTLYGPDGTEVARAGEFVAAGGGEGFDEVCGETAFSVQSEVTMLKTDPNPSTPDGPAPDGPTTGRD